MSRLIQFRAWDKERKEMRKVKSMDWNEWWVSTEYVEDVRNGRPQPLEFGERNSFANQETDRHILMQYTGLTLDGKEVYEHDIVLVVAEDENGKEIGRETCVVDFERQSFVYAPSLDHRGLTQDELFRRYKARYLRWELLGNLYDHPHLLGRTATDSTE